jgi:hypothetical protein
MSCNYMQQNPSSDATGRYHDERNPGIPYSPNFQGMITIYRHIQQLFHIQSQTDKKKKYFPLIQCTGCPKNQIISRRSFTKEPRIRLQANLCGIWFNKLALGQVLLQRLRLSTVKTIPPHFTLPSPSNWEYRSIRYLKPISLWTVFTYYYFNINVTISRVFRIIEWSLTVRFPLHKFVKIFHLSHSCYMSQ